MEMITFLMENIAFLILSVSTIKTKISTFFHVIGIDNMRENNVNKLLIDVK